MRAALHGSSIPSIVLWFCYTMPGAHLSHAALVLCVGYAMSGTDLGYAATRWARIREMDGRRRRRRSHRSAPIVPLSSYAFAMRRPVLTNSMPTRAGVARARSSRPRGAHPGQSTFAPNPKLKTLYPRPETRDPRP
eukprot:3939007-Rhodomonas_salina.1